MKKTITAYLIYGASILGFYGLGGYSGWWHATKLFDGVSSGTGSGYGTGTGGHGGGWGMGGGSGGSSGGFRGGK